MGNSVEVNVDNSHYCFVRRAHIVMTDKVDKDVEVDAHDGDDQEGPQVISFTIVLPSGDRIPIQVFISLDFWIPGSESH